MTEQDGALPEIAFYYPGHWWQSGDWVKSLLLFFDGVGLLVPEHKKFEPEEHDEYVARPLIQAGLLKVLPAEKVVNQEATQQLATVMDHLIDRGALDPLINDGATHGTLSLSRAGFSGDPVLARQLFRQLEVRGLAAGSEDEHSISIHPRVRELILALLAQILRPQGQELGLDLSPVTDDEGLTKALSKLLAGVASPAQGEVITVDLRSVGVDLSAAPIDEVLGFRREHLAAHRAYMRSVRRFVREVSALPGEERPRAMQDRQEEIEQAASDLARRARRAWGGAAASFALGIAGATWVAAVGGPWAASVLSYLAGHARAAGAPGDEISAYSYLFAVRRQYA